MKMGKNNDPSSQPYDQFHERLAAIPGTDPVLELAAGRTVTLPPQGWLLRANLIPKTEATVSVYRYLGSLRLGSVEDSREGKIPFNEVTAHMSMQQYAERTIRYLRHMPSERWMAEIARSESQTLIPLAEGYLLWDALPADPAQFITEGYFSLSWHDPDTHRAVPDGSYAINRISGTQDISTDIATVTPMIAGVAEAMSMGSQDATVLTSLVATGMLYLTQSGAGRYRAPGEPGQP